MSILVGSSACSVLQRVAGDVVLPPEDEITLGRELAAQVEQHYRMHPDPVVQQYVADLGEIFVRASGEPRPEIEWSFKVIDAPDQVNAMALPGGWIYLFSGLFLVMESEAELVGVIAHEIAHVNERHIAERLATIYGVELLAAVALGQDPGALEQIVATIIAQGYLLRYSRSQEREADSLALDYAIEAGWDPRGLVSFFEHLAEYPRPPQWLSTHPSPDARVDLVNEQLAGRTIPTRLGQERYQAVRERIEAGIDPDAAQGDAREPPPNPDGCTGSSCSRRPVDR